MDKRQAKQDFKMQKTDKGVFAVRCAEPALTWVSASMNLKASETGVMFGLRNGMHHNKAMQAAWNSRGEAAFRFEVLETFAEDLPLMELRDLMRSRQKYWIQELGATAV